ncbi:lipopolysaccharide biosynthesis protein [Melioribacter sp. Ez-97]|uniref:lipopolysaccharide biosynthesis protein n=1 Tax=Melioribacter sp. Ez-97 TaxID=3423434 RepID=UPI003ED866C5
MDLKKKSLSALIWSFVDSFGVYVVRFGFTIAIARKLSPKDYGLAGMVTIFIALATLIAESGFSMALIQKKNSDQRDYSTVFFFNLIASIFLYIVLFFSAGLIANFYNEPIVKDITRVASIGVVFSALITVHITILTKNLEFKIPAFIRMCSALISGVLGVFMAYNGFGVWALVYPTLAGSLLSVLLFWIFNRWKPSMVFSIESFKLLYKYGVNIFAQGFTSILLDQIYYPLIGKFYSATELGYFSNADRFYQIFVRRITISYGRVAFPAFSSLQDKPIDFANAYRKTTISLAFILLPLTALLIVSAKPVILILLTNKWANSIPFLQLLYLDGFIFPFLLLNQNVLNALGKSKLSLIIDTVKKIFVIIGAFIAFKIGIQALIISQITSTAIGLLVSIFFIKENIIKQNLIYDLIIIIFTTLIFTLCSILVLNIILSNIVTVFIQILLFLMYFFTHKYLQSNGYKYFIKFISPIIPEPIQKYI